MISDINELKSFLDTKVQFYERTEFIAEDPISIPHRFTNTADIEIAGFFAATLAWGRRPAIINSCNRLLQMMDNAPHQFIVQHAETDLKPFVSFVHRTFNATDLLYFIYWLRHHYTHYNSIEQAFVPEGTYHATDTKQALSSFYNSFFSLSHPQRTCKHVATPERNSACKRLNMFLRWMVRSNAAGVDFGIWEKLSPAQLICPLDVHVARVACRLGLIDTEKSDWKNALALTCQLRLLDPQDPVKYDFALFSVGVNEKL